MPGSQLKRLKASLRDQGITGPQQSKKQKRRAAQDERGRNDKRLQRGVVLDGIREQFNPFDLKHAARGPKFEVTSNRPLSGNTASGVKGRPGQAKAASEERRRQTLLVDMQRRNKVGGILDRRFGENDPTMAPEDKMLERFAREKQKSHKKSSMFDLEDDGLEEGLTHGGKSLTFDDDEPVDDFQEDDLDYDSDGSVRERQRLKRVRAMGDSKDEDEDDEQPERKKTKKEVMEEIIAKSKMHKAERQQAKEEDEDLRDEVDKEMSSIQMLLSSTRDKRPAEAGATTIAGLERDAFDRNFDMQVKRLAQDKRAQPADRTKTDEEKAEDESKRLKELEDRRQRRMRGEEVTDSEEDESDKDAPETRAGAMEMDGDEDDDDFGLGSGIKTKARPTAAELGFDDEDDFIIEDDLVASGSDLEPADSDMESDEDGEHDSEQDGDGEEDDFTKGLLNEEESRNPIFDINAPAKKAEIKAGDQHGLPFTFPCPQDLAELHGVVAPYPHKHLPTIIQRIRALYHPKLDSKNKERLARFSETLVDYVASPWDPDTSAPFSILESLVRHIHSLSKSYPVEVSNSFRHHLEEVGQSRPLALQPADLILLSAVSSIFPTSDHFHQVVTPAMLTIARYLGQKVPQSLGDYTTGTFLSILSLQYQQLSKRYVPEVINFTLNTMCGLAPAKASKQSGGFPLHEPPSNARLQKAKGASSRRLTFADCMPGDGRQTDLTTLKVSILETSVKVVDAAADTWVGKSSFQETFQQAVSVLQHLTGSACRAQLPKSLVDSAGILLTKLERMLKLAQLSRRPLTLHHHRPLAIKTYIPKFEDTFDPDKHYDPDRERAELAKLKKEHKKERKGAMRELRKDANFMAREKLRAKKTKDEAYEKKFKRLVSEIQSEEGKEANAYEREKAARKRAKDR